MNEDAQERTIAGARRRIAETLRESGIESPELDARLLIGHALGLTHAQLASDAARILSEQDMDAIKSLVMRRLRREPVARITGRKEFWSLPLRVSAATLVPRPDTETIVEAALAAAGHSKRTMRILDLGTGTGAILLALLNELPNATGLGSDINPLTLEIACANARELGFENRSRFIVSDFGAALTETFDLIVSNPPYIATSELSDLPPEVRDYDPRIALDGGPDGLDCYRRIAADAPRLLNPEGIIVVEIGAGQSAAITAIFKTAGFKATSAPQPDLAGVPRALVFQGFS